MPLLLRRVLHLRCSIPRARHRLKRGEPFIYVRQRREGHVWLRLVPIRNGKEVVGAMIGMTVLDRRLHRRRERNGRIEVETIHAGSRACLFLSDLRSAVEGVGKRTAPEVPG